ncbi:hypothetical protein [Jiulongibacter sediminis]|mgnify:CR=1 FL=1|jgi:hypothetical protein|uniref:hypothetical protein n=1 Tax=Jiulongibacter sediminis TaxID=1605367 RepID=UPI0026F2B909|nr:hypothetical protein [Jiulongibacter sediminis]
MMQKLMLLSVFLLVLVACKKDPVDSGEQKPVIELLTNNSSKTWQVQDGVAKQGDLEVNLIASQNPCVTDNQITLYSNFSYEFKEGATKCNPNDPDTILTANWELAADESSITIDRFVFLGRSVDNPTFTLSDVTENTFSGTTTVTLNNETFEITVIFESVN